jgi:transposase
MVSVSSRRIRTREPQRTQGVIRFEMPEDRLPTDHPARALWQIVERLDLSAFLADAKAVEGGKGRDRASVRMLMTLWLYAISVGVGSAREIERRLSADAAFQWIVGDERVGRSTLSTFRVGHREALDKLFSDVLGTLVHRGLVSLDLVAQDGTRVRASASAPSFRREASLQECREQAELHLKAVLAEADDPDVDLRRQRVREAKARDFEQRVNEAIDVVRELQERGLGGDEPRASTTDPDARVMKMADGGFRPGYNVQLATAGASDGGPRTVVGVQVTNVGSDMSSISPMLDDIEKRTGQLPKDLLADRNHASMADIKDATERGVSPHIAVPKRSQTKGPRADHSPEVVAWHARMSTEEAKEKMRARSGLSELTNAHAKTRFAMASVLVRGIDKVTSVVLLTMLTANLLAHAPALLA